MTSRAARWLPTVAVLMIATAAVPGCVSDTAPSAARSRAAPTAGSQALDEQTADAVRFRRAFALNDSLQHIAMVKADPSAVVDYGVPLLPEEVATIESRSTVAERAMPTIEAYGIAHANQYGGVYLDHDRGGVIVTLWTGSICDHARGLWSALADVAPATPVRLRLVSHSLAELEDLQSRVTADMDAWRAEGIDVTAVLLDTANNRLQIGVAGPTSAAEDRLLAEYGVDRVVVTSMEGGTAP